MKKILFAWMIVTVFLLSGCANEKEGKLVCIKNQEIDTSTKLESTYSVNYKGGYVTTLNTKEVIISDNETTLQTYKENLENVYKAYNDIEHYSNNIKIEGNKLVSITQVDYEQIDTDKLIEIDANNKVAIENGKVKVATLKQAYEQLEATCKEE